MIPAHFADKPEFALRPAYVRAAGSLPVGAGKVIRTETIDGKPWECRLYELASGRLVFCHNVPQ